VAKYNDILWEALQTSGLAVRASNLTKQAKIQMSRSQQEEYEKIDKEATEHKCHAESKCRKI